MPNESTVLRDLQRRILLLEASLASDVPTYADMDKQGGTIQSFRLDITNDSGTLKHRIGSWNSGAAAADLASKITSARNSYTNTPTGTDSSTAFAAGGKISSVNTNRWIFDVANAQDLGATTVATFFAPSSGMPATLHADGGLSSDNVNGTTRVRPAVSFIYHNGTDWAAWALNTTNITSGKTLSVKVFALLK